MTLLPNTDDPLEVPNVGFLSCFGLDKVWTLGFSWIWICLVWVGLDADSDLNCFALNGSVLFCLSWLWWDIVVLPSIAVCFLTGNLTFFLFSCDFSVWVLSIQDLASQMVAFQNTTREISEMQARAQRILSGHRKWWLIFSRTQKTNTSCFFIESIGGTWFRGFSKSSGAWCLLWPVAMKIYFVDVSSCPFYP